VRTLEISSLESQTPEILRLIHSLLLALGKSMNVLFLDQTGQLGGAELSLLDLSQSFSKGSSVALFQDGPFRERLEEAGVRVEVIHNSVQPSTKDSGILKGMLSFFSAFPLIRQISKRAKSYDCLYANTQKAFIFGAVASVISGRPIVYHLRDILSTDYLSQTNLSVVTWFANRCATIVIANSEATEKAFIKAGGNAQKVKVVYNGFNPTNYSRNDQSRKTLREQFGVSDRFVIGQFSRLSPWKGQHILLEALKSTSDSTVALFVGAALFGEDEYASQLEQQVQVLGLGDRVKFLGFRSDVAELMQACDAIAHTSVTPEPFGRVIVEAMFSRRPVIATAAGGAIELIEPNKTGWLTEPGNAEDLTQAIHSIQQDSMVTDSIVQTAYAQAFDRFHIDSTNRQIAMILNTI